MRRKCSSASASWIQPPATTPALLTTAVQRTPLVDDPLEQRFDRTSAR